MRVVRRKTKDRERAVPIGVCTLCGLESYPGQSFVRIWGNTVCRDCLIRLLTGGKREEVLG